jgi:hypothetical protein
MRQQMLGHKAAADALDRDGDAPIAPARQRRQRVAAPVTHASDVDADADVLARDVVLPTAPRPQPQRDAVAGLRHHLLDTPARLARRPERVQLPEKVVRKKRCGEYCGCVEETDT